VVVRSYLGVGAAAGDGVAAVAVGGLGRHFVTRSFAGLVMMEMELVLWCFWNGAGLEGGFVLSCPEGNMIAICESLSSGHL
jgi:hypothetical protein